jgi:uncharacterized protein YbjT (DUF2867 family)
MILVVGGTGRLGTPLVRLLTSCGQTVRVLARDVSRAPTQPNGLVEFAAGDVRDRSSLARMMDGVTVVVSAKHGFPGNRHENPTTIDRDGNINLADAAVSAGADLVMMSVVGASPTHAMELFRMKYAAEEHARQTGLPLTVIRSSAYLELWIGILQQTAQRTGRPIVFGGGKNPINFVSVDDVAVIVDRAVADPSVRGQILHVTGPDNLTMTELAGFIQSAAGRTSTPRHLPRGALRIAAKTIGRINPAIGRQLRAAQAMDSIELTAGPCHLPEGYPAPATTASMLLAPPPAEIEEHTQQRAPR